MGISTQTTLTGDVTKPYADRQRLRTLYLEDEKSVKEIASQFDCSTSTIRNYIKGFGIGDGSSGGAVSFYTNGDGYEYLRVDNHYLRFHRVLVIAEHGLDALDDESVVHHCTEVPWDNRPDELRVFASQSEHASFHASEPIPEEQQTFTEMDLPLLDDESKTALKRPPDQRTLNEFLDGQTEKGKSTG
jgi:hypothetical protein